MFQSTFRQMTSNCCAALCLGALLTISLLPVGALAGAVHLSDFAGGITGQEFGGSVCGVGDVNGDGLNDILVGAPGESNTGAAFLWFGSPDITHSPGESWYGVANEEFGFSVAAIGDVNNDGDPDFAIGAPLSNANASTSGRICIYYGGSSLPSTPDLIIYGQNSGDQFGFSMAAAGDFDGDGKDDFIVGAPYSNSAALNAGAAYVIYGASGGPSDDLADATLLVGEIAEDHFGWSVSGAGNFLGGNEESVAVGAPLNNTHGGTDAGAVYVFEGAVPPTNPNSTSDHVLSIGANAPGSSYGWVVKHAGRWDSDSYDDLAVGAPTHNSPGTSAGRIEIIFGDPNPSTTGDRHITGGNAGDQLGFSLDNLGDFTGNGKDDLIIGAPFLVDDGSDAGRAYRYEGGTSSSGAVSILDAILVDPLVTGNNANNRFGLAVAGLGDFDGDGSTDYAVGAPGGQIGNEAPAGYCLLQASHGQTVAAFAYQAESQWTEGGQVNVLLALPLAPAEILSLEIVRLPGSLIHTGPVYDLALPGSNSDGYFRYQLLDEGPFALESADAGISYQATIRLVSGGIIQLSDPVQWEPLMMDQQPGNSLLMARQAWPNPANPRTALEYSVARGEYYHLNIRDLRGRLVRQLTQGEGTDQWTRTVWDGLDDSGQALPSGLYFFDLRTRDSLQVRKVMLAR